MDIRSILRRGVMWLGLCAGLSSVGIAHADTQWCSQGTTPPADCAASKEASALITLDRAVAVWKTGVGPAGSFTFSNAGAIECHVNNQYEMTCGGRVTTAQPVAGGDPLSYAPRTSVVELPGTAPPPPQPSSCAANSGKTIVRNVTIGWSRVSAAEAQSMTSEQYGKTLIGGEMQLPELGSHLCVAGCLATVGAMVTPWHGETPTASGTYRLSADHTMVSSSTACDTTSEGSNGTGYSAANPAAPPAKCDGYSGLVNGKVTCVPPAAPASASAPTGGGAGSTQGNPAAGSDGAVSGRDPTRSPTDGTGTPSGGPLTPYTGTKKGESPAAPGTGASGGGSGSTGTDGKNQDGGDCAKNPSASGCGGAPANHGTLYTGKGRTVAQAFADAKSVAGASPLGGVAGSFFTVGGGGSCPTWSGTVPYLNAAMTIDQFCSPFAASMLALMKYALMVVASFMAFRIAIE